MGDDLSNVKNLVDGSNSSANRLKLSENFKVFPREIFELEKSLEILDLSENQLDSLPDDFDRLKNLKILFLSKNRFSKVPEILGKLDQLEMIGFKSNQITQVPEYSLPAKTRWLILTDNRIPHLPQSMGDLSRLQKCMLAGNDLSDLPDSMQQCKNLELLRISANNFREIPSWLLNLPKLAWLAFAGNPVSTEKTQTLIDAKSLQQIPLSEFNLAEKLGEGASGNIFLAERFSSGKGASEKVAIKIFKGDVTSDGYPIDELNANIAVGNHANLVTNLAQISDKTKSGLIMEMIPENYRNLGLPPSFESCTRDIFESNLTLNVDEVIKISRAMVSVLAHIHTRKISHGDTYAHNVLIDNHCNLLFGDFGAATIYGCSGFSRNQEKLIERIEVRAFGYMLDDLTRSLSDQTNNSADLFNLYKIKDLCLKSSVSERPGFDELAKLLHR